MKKLLTYVVVFFAISCNSEDAWDIVKTRGDRKTENREVGNFTGITIYNGINVVLEKADKSTAVLDGWSNLLPKVDLTTASNGMLTIKDNNKFDIVRNPNNKTSIHLYYSGEINTITFHGDGVISNVDTLHSTSPLGLLCEDASGSLELVIKTPSVGIGTNNRNVADIKLEGVCSYLGITNWGNAPIHAEKLEVLSCDITHRGPGDFYMNVSGQLNVNIYSIGDVYYKGNPTLTVNRKGKGNVFPIR